MITRLILYLFCYGVLAISCQEKVAKEKHFAPNFEFINFAGQTFDLPHFKGKKIYLNFWTVTCKPCLDDFYTYQDILPKINNRTRVLLHICMDASPTQIEAYLAKFNINIPDIYTIQDIDELILKYDIGAFPHHAVINEEGIVIRNQYRTMLGDLATSLQ